MKRDKKNLTRWDGKIESNANCFMRDWEVEKINTDKRGAIP